MDWWYLKNTGEKNQDFLNINICYQLALCVAPRQDKSQVAIETTLTFLDEDQSKALQATVQCRGAGSSLKLRGTP